MNIGNLYLVATPIGNLKDITERALETLKQVDIILCENPSETQNLLNHFDIDTNTKTYNQHTRQGKMLDIHESLQKGKNIALVSDAGTPAISDPGGRLVEYVTQQEGDVKIIPIPGSSAVTAALSICGFPANEFVFLGFAPNKSERKNFFQTAVNYEKTVVFYESKHRLKSALEQLDGNISPERKICICRDMTKKFESIYRGTIEELKEENIKNKGEFTIILDGRIK